MATANHMTLSQLNKLIRATIAEWMSDAGDIWVLAELAECRQHTSGHWYLNLVEKKSDSVVASLSAVIWSREAGTVNDFVRATGQRLAPGMAVLMRGRVDFHERFGLKLIISELDATYTLGEMARKRQEVIERLRREGILGRNGALAMPVAPQRVAVISSGQAAGYGDLMRHLTGNPHGYVFHTTLFEAAMQGDAAEQSVADALARVSRRAASFDVAVVIRGGGSQIDLNCFDGYAVAAAICACPVPVITGIGHDRDESVADLAAHTRAKTPTDAAQMLVARINEFEQEVDAAITLAAKLAAARLNGDRVELTGVSGRFAVAPTRLMSAWSARVASGTAAFASDASRHLRAGAMALDQSVRGLSRAPTLRLAVLDARLAPVVEALASRGKRRLQSESEQLGACERNLSIMDPANVLKRGFSITRFRGAAVTDPATLRHGATLETELYRGTVRSKIVKAEVDSGQGVLDL